jgi:hypothetical protein
MDIQILGSTHPYRMFSMNSWWMSFVAFQPGGPFTADQGPGRPYSWAFEN